jgi:NAD-dependent deacetylase
MAPCDPMQPPPTLLAALGAARRPLLLSGAGLSAESGLATFRGGGDSLWSRFDPFELATPQAFESDPDLVWAWYRWRMALAARAQPNAGHRAIAALATLIPGLVIASQNVDDLHERAGSRGVLHLHGSLSATRCSRCALPQPVPIEPDWAEARELRAAPPACSACGGRIRPGVVWFGEPLPEAALSAASAAAQRADLILVVGTSGLVHPAAALPGLAPALVPRFEINPQPSALAADMRACWRAPAAEALPRLLERLQGPAAVP